MAYDNAYRIKCKRKITKVQNNLLYIIDAIYPLKIINYLLALNAGRGKIAKLLKTTKKR